MSSESLEDALNVESGDYVIGCEHELIMGSGRDNNNFHHLESSLNHGPFEEAVIHNKEEFYNHSHQEGEDLWKSALGVPQEETPVFSKPMGLFSLPSRDRLLSQDFCENIPINNNNNIFCRPLEAPYHHFAQYLGTGQHCRQSRCSSFDFNDCLSMGPREAHLAKIEESDLSGRQPNCS